MKRALGVLALVATMTACTPAQATFWMQWHREDPDAAQAFLASPEGQATLDDTASDGPQFLEWLTAEGTPGDCDSYTALFQRHGLPAATFRAIAWRESGCNHLSFVRDSDDLGGGLLGLNLRAGADRWRAWCGLTVANVTDAERNVACAAAAYRRMGMAPWRT